MAFMDRPYNCPADIDAIETYGGVWPKDRPFPFTPEEALWLLKGYSVRPQAGLPDDAFELLPGGFEIHNGYAVLRRS